MGEKNWFLKKASFQQDRLYVIRTKRNVCQASFRKAQASAAAATEKLAALPHESSFCLETATRLLMPSLSSRWSLRLIFPPA